MTSDLDTTINVYAKELTEPWLFDDLKIRFSSASVPGLSVISSSEPVEDADCWVAIRTAEAVASPDKRKTVSCIHDLYEHDGIYEHGGMRRVVEDVGGLVLCHPTQRDILENHHIRLEGKVILERPIGSLSAFKPRKTLSDKFTIGWVGRNFWRKRIEWFLEAMRLLAMQTRDFRVVLAGLDLEETAESLRGLGIECACYPRASTPIERYPAIYGEMDCLAITSMTEAGPLTLFEALSCGVPVVSTPVGWAPLLARRVPDSLRIARSAASISEEIAKLIPERRRHFDRRMEMSRLMGHWTMESWIDDVLNLAASLAA